MHKLQSPQNLDLSLVWGQCFNPELPDFEVYALYTKLLFITKYKSQKTWLLLPKSAVTLNTPITLTILLESLLWRIRDICQQTFIYYHVSRRMREKMDVREWFKGQALELATWTGYWSSYSSLSCVCLGKLFNLSVPEFPLLKN